MSRGAVATVAAKDLRDFSRTPATLLMLLALCGVAAISCLISALDFRGKVMEYQNYVVALKRAQSSVIPEPPHLYPLQLLTGSLEYLEIIGALMAIIVGYSLVAKERRRGTIDLIFVRPLSQFGLGLGKLATLALIWLAFSALFMTSLGAILLLVGGASLAPIDLLRLVITAGMSWFYLLFWSALGLALAAHSNHLSSALIWGLTAWLVAVLILPQIGDTMDPDNQVPGGLFNSLHVGQAQQNAVMAHFGAYESVRNFVEIASVEKNYERSVFGITGVNELYNQEAPSAVVGSLWPNMSAVVVWAALGAIWASIACRRSQLLARESAA